MTFTYKSGGKIFSLNPNSDNRFGQRSEFPATHYLWIHVTPLSYRERLINVFSVEIGPLSSMDPLDSTLTITIIHATLPGWQVHFTDDVIDLNLGKLVHLINHFLCVDIAPLTRLLTTMENLTI